jgi:hypothetical protein
VPSKVRGVDQRGCDISLMPKALMAYCNMNKAVHR